MIVVIYIYIALFQCIDPNEIYMKYLCMQLSPPLNSKSVLANSYHFIRFEILLCDGENLYEMYE